MRKHHVAIRQIVRAGLLALSIAITGCAGTMGGLGNVLGGGMGANQGNTVSGYVKTVDPRSSLIVIRTPDGQDVSIGYDQQTVVEYGNGSYQVGNLEYGDNVSASVQATRGGYYTDHIQVNRSVSDREQQGNEELFQGTVFNVDRTYGSFTLEAGDGSRTYIYLSRSISTNEMRTFYRLRTGDYARFYGTRMGGSRIELNRFY